MGDPHLFRRNRTIVSEVQAHYPHMICCGRLGSYQYLDMFQAVGQALSVVSKLEQRVVHPAKSCTMNVSSLVTRHTQQAQVAPKKLLADRFTVGRILPTLSAREGCVLSGRFRFGVRRLELPRTEKEAPATPLNIVITCKGRLHHLKHTLPAVLLQSYAGEYRVIVVDYGDPDGAFDYCVELAHPKLVAMRVLDNVDTFNLSRARNCGANLLPADVLCFADADSILHPRFLEYATHLIRRGKAGLTKREFTDRCTSTCGLCCVRTALFHAVRGYDEAFRGWGPEDVDFYNRVGAIAITRSFPSWLYPTTIPHSDADRTKFYAIKERWLSASQGGSRAALRNRTVNADGYGRCSCLIYRCGGDERVQEQLLQEPQIDECIAS